MAVTQYIAPTIAEDLVSGAEIVVGASPVGISFYGQQGSESVGRVVMKKSDGNFYPLRAKVNESKPTVEVILSINLGDFPLVEPGIYKVQKFATKGTVGIDITEV